MLTLAEAAARLGISVRRAQRLAQERRIKGARKMGRDWRVPDPPVVTEGRRGPRGTWENGA